MDRHMHGDSYFYEKEGKGMRLEDRLRWPRGDRCFAQLSSGIKWLGCNGERI